jgi:hypothetical protein
MNPPGLLDQIKFGYFIENEKPERKSDFAGCLKMPFENPAYFFLQNIADKFRNYFRNYFE